MYFYFAVFILNTYGTEPFVHESYLADHSILKRLGCLSDSSLRTARHDAVWSALGHGRFPTHSLAFEEFFLSETRAI